MKLAPAVMLFSLVGSAAVHGQTLFSVDFGSYASGTSLSSVGWTMSTNPSTGTGAMQITNNTGFGSGIVALDGSTGTGRDGYIGATKLFTQSVVAGETLTLTSQMYLYASQNTSWIGLYNGQNGSTGDPTGIRLDAGAGSSFGLSFVVGDVGSTRIAFGPALVDGIYTAKIFVNGADQTTWAEVAFPSGTKYTSTTLALSAGTQLTDLVGVQLYVKNFGGYADSADIANVTVTAVPEPATAAALAGLGALGAAALCGRNRRAV